MSTAIEQLVGVSDPAEVAAHLTALEQEIARRRYTVDPIFWAEHRLGDTLWSKQKEIIQAVRDSRRTAVKSCHQIGKSYIAAITIGWWIDAHAPGEAFVVTSAPSAPQIKAILWREIGRVHARGNLAGRVNQTEWYITPVKGGNEELVAFGRKPDDYDPTAFQGIHAPYVLYVFDEACGIPMALWEAADSLIANDTSKALAIGNPDDPTSEFHEICKPGSGWKVIEVGAFDTPNFTGEQLPELIKRELIGRTYVEEKRKKWAPHWYWVNKAGERCKAQEGAYVRPPEGSRTEDTNPLWQSKVLGRFPPISTEGGLIPISWVRQAQERTLHPVGDHALSLDVGGGGDASTCGEAKGPVFRIRWEDHNPDTMQTCGRFIAELALTGAKQGKVDYIGIGRGIVDRAKELKKPVIPVVASEGAQETDAYVNYRSECWWHVRELFEQGLIDIDPNDEDLASELTEIKFKRLSNGKIQVESKLDMKKRNVSSPNRADALMLAYAKTKPKLTQATWGRRKR